MIGLSDPSNQVPAAGNQSQASGVPADPALSLFNNFLETLEPPPSSVYHPVERSEAISARFHLLQDKLESGEIQMEEVNELSDMVKERVTELRVMSALKNKIILKKKEQIDNFQKKLDKLAEERAKAETDIAQ